jgi:hypothetical protein
MKNRIAAYVVIGLMLWIIYEAAVLLWRLAR